MKHCPICFYPISDKELGIIYRRLLKEDISYFHCENCGSKVLLETDILRGKKLYMLSTFEGDDDSELLDFY